MSVTTTIAPAPKGLPSLDLSGESMTVTRKMIDTKHPDYLLNQDLWVNVNLLYEGGNAIKRCAERFLERRPKESSEVYNYRVSQFDYENNLGAGLGSHEAQMFENDPAVEVKVRGKDGQSNPDAKLSPDQDEFYNQRFLKDCDKHGTTFVDTYRKVFTHLLLFGESFISVDLPARQDQTAPKTLQEERDAKLLDPYICAIEPGDVINWEKDDYGNFVWVVLYGKTEQQEFLKKPVTVERWYYYDRQQYRVYEARYSKPEESISITDAAASAISASMSQIVDAEKVPIHLILAGYHCLAQQNLVPLQHIRVPKGWWLGNRAYLPAMEHLNISNALKWSLFMAALAVPVLITDDDVSNLTVAEMSFIKLSVGSDYKFAEPSGRCWEWLSNRARTLTEEIWRSLYLISQSRTTTATASAQSGISKQMDMAPSHDVLNGFGDVLRAAMQRTLQLVAWARVQLGFLDDNLLPDVRGFAFAEKLSSDEIAIIENLLQLQIPSDTAEKEFFILAVRAALRDANPDTLQDIINEIRSSPDKLTRQLNEQQAQSDQEMQQLQKQMSIQMATDDPEGTGT